MSKRGNRDEEREEMEDRLSVNKAVQQMLTSHDEQSSSCKQLLDDEEEEMPLLTHKDSGLVSPHELSFDGVLCEIGEIGYYQALWALIALLGGANCAFHYSVIQYLIEKPINFWCTESEWAYITSRKLGSSQTCVTFGENCTNWSCSTTDMTLEKTIVTQWDLYCQPVTLFAFIESMYLIFAGIGMVCNGSLADRIGRKSTVLLLTVMEMVTGIAQAFSNDIFWFSVFRFMNGFVSGAAYCIGYILAVELVGPKWRALMSTISALYFEIFRVICGVLAIKIDDWKKLMLFGSVLDIPVIFCLLFLTVESPRWLFKSGRRKQAILTLRKIAKCNGKNLPPCIETGGFQCDTDESRGQALDLFRTPKMRLRSLEMFFSFFVLLLLYWDLSLSTESFATEEISAPMVLIIYSIVTSLVVVPLTTPLLNGLGRRWTHAGNLFIASIMMVAAPFANDFGKTIVGIAGMLSLTFVYYTIYIRAFEVFPTPLRSIGTGCCSVFGYTGAILFPYIDLVSQGDYYWISSIIYGSLTLSGAFVALHLPETANQDMPESIQDVEDRD